MSGLRDVVFTLILAGLVPASFLRPWIGVLAWSWIAYMAPHRLTWGFAQVLPVAMLIGGATLAGFVLRKDGQQKLPRTTGTFLLVALAADFIMTTALSYSPAYSVNKLQWILKAMLMGFVTMGLFQDRFRLRLLYLTIAMSMGFYGFKGGLWVLRTGGLERVRGSGTTFFADNNTLGLALCMVLPMILYMSRDVASRWLKLFLRTMFGLTTIAILFTYSRGAFLGLAVVLAILAWRSPWRMRFAAAIVVASLVAAPLLPERLWDRIASIADQDSAETRDRSATTRLESWALGWSIAVHRPLTGAGFGAFNQPELWDRYQPERSRVVNDAHSLYFEVLGEQGLLGFGLYMTLLLTSLVALERMRKRWRGHPEHGYLSRYSEMIQLSLIPFMIAGGFLTVAYFDLYLHLVATVSVLQALSNKAAMAGRAAAGAPRARTALSRVVTQQPRPRPGPLAGAAPGRPYASRWRGEPGAREEYT